MIEERAVLAGSCCWGMKQIFGNLEGVVSTRAGHTGRSLASAYDNRGFHAGAVEILFDPRLVSYRAILDLFFQIHDPTMQREGGGSYRSAIFYTSEAQQRIALETIADVDGGNLWPGPVLTEVVKAGSFWAPEAHSAQGPGGHTCHLVLLHRKLPASMTIDA